MEVRSQLLPLLAPSQPAKTTHRLSGNSALPNRRLTTNAGHLCGQTQERERVLPGVIRRSLKNSIFRQEGAIRAGWSLTGRCAPRTDGQPVPLRT